MFRSRRTPTATRPRAPAVHARRLTQWSALLGVSGLAAAASARRQVWHASPMALAAAAGWGAVPVSGEECSAISGSPLAVPCCVEAVQRCLRPLLIGTGAAAVSSFGGTVSAFGCGVPRLRAREQMADSRAKPIRHRVLQPPLVPITHSAVVVALNRFGVPLHRQQSRQARGCSTSEAGLRLVHRTPPSGARDPARGRREQGRARRMASDRGHGECWSSVSV